MLGGTQSLHTNSYDEALALPTEDAVRIALRTQQVIAEETGVTNTIDPLGGSYFVEALTDELEAPGLRLLRQDRRARRHGRGGQAQLPRSARSPRPASATSRSSTRAAAGWSASTRYIEGDDDGQIPILRIDPTLEGKQIERLQAARDRRDDAAAEQALRALVDAAADERTTSCPACSTPPAPTAPRARSSTALQTVFGTYTETPVF